MSQAINRARLAEAVARFNDTANRQRYLELYAPDAVLHGYHGVEPGIDSIRQFYERFWATFPDAHLTIGTTLAEGELLSCEFVVHATHRSELMGIPPTGKAVALPGVTILRFRDGKCVERWSQADFLGLLMQLGAVPGANPAA
jgi:predicted ester cyclase